MQQIIYAMGDVHGNFEKINDFISKTISSNRRLMRIAKEDKLEIVILQCGDFGFFWPGIDNSSAIKNKVDFLKDGYVKIYWCHENHEEHDELDYLKAKHVNQVLIEVAPHVYYATFGAVLTLCDKTKIMFCGGAESAVRDRENRIQYKNDTGERIWWEQEGISDEDMKSLPNAHIDWIVSHARPIGVPLRTVVSDHHDESSQYYLENIRKKYSPTKWFHGHYHVYEREIFENCGFICLNESEGKGWYKLVAHINKKQSLCKRSFGEMLHLFRLCEKMNIIHITSDFWSALI